MKLFLFISIITTLSSFGQDSSLAMLEVVYETKHMKDSNLVTNFTTDYITMHVSKDISKYYNYELWVLEQNPTKSYSEDFRPRSNYLNAYFNFFHNKILYTEQVLAKSKFGMEIEYPSIDWKLDTTKKIILGYICQRATGYFKGRNYQVWFCPELPFSSGPWKFCGLPGLILEVVDEKKQVFFTAQLVSNVSKKNIFLEKSSRAIKTTAKDYQLVVDAYQRDPISFIDSEFNVKSIDPPKVPKKKKINNPIELKID